MDHKEILRLAESERRRLDALRSDESRRKMREAKKGNWMRFFIKHCTTIAAGLYKPFSSFKKAYHPFVAYRP